MREKREGIMLISVKMTGCEGERVREQKHRGRKRKTDVNNNNVKHNNIKSINKKPDGPPVGCPLRSCARCLHTVAEVSNQL